MAAFFKPSIDAIIEGLKQAFENGGRLADVSCPRPPRAPISLNDCLLENNSSWRLSELPICVLQGIRVG